MIRINVIAEQSYWPKIDIRDIKGLLRRFLNDKKSTNKYVYLHNYDDISHYEKAIKNIEDCTLKSGLESLLQKIDIDRELLDGVEIPFQAIDMAALDVLIDEVNDTELSNSFFYSRERLSFNRIRQLFDTRIKSIPYRNDINKLSKIKRIGGNYMVYDAISTVITRYADNLKEMKASELVFDLLFDVLDKNRETSVRIKKININLARIENINSNHVTKSVDLNYLKSITRMWINCNSFTEIIVKFKMNNLSINALVFIIKYFIEDYVVKVFSNLLKYLEVNGYELKREYEEYNKIKRCLGYGCKSLLSLALYEIGVYDKVLNRHLTKFLKEKKQYFNNISELKEFLINEWDGIVVRLEEIYDRKYVEDYINNIN